MVWGRPPGMYNSFHSWCRSTDKVNIDRADDCQEVLKFRWHHSHSHAPHMPFKIKTSQATFLASTKLPVLFLFPTTWGSQLFIPVGILFQYFPHHKSTLKSRGRFYIKIKLFPPSCKTPPLVFLPLSFTTLIRWNESCLLEIHGHRCWDEWS